ncbi:MAG: hypothetical protein NDI84_08275 [Steroidobacteraceae bacterium]|nr:hypothetical protein [Steroidobacteraceae bacterium]
MRQQTAEAITDGFKVAPPVGVMAVTIAGMSLQDWVYVLTIVYTLMLIAQHAWTKWVKPWLTKPE